MTAIAVVLLWLAADYRLYLLREGGGYVKICYAAASTSIAAAFTVKAAETAVDAVTGPYVSDLLEHGLVVVGGVAAQLFLLALKTGRPARRAAAVRCAIAAGVLAAMTITFSTAPIHHRVTGDLDEVFGHLTSITVYRLVFNVYLTYVLLENVRLCRRYAASPGNAGRSASLTLVGWGSTIALAYSTSRILYVLADLVLHDRPTVIRTVGSAAAALGLCGLAIGVLAPRVVPGLDRWIDALRGTRRLEPLWRDLTATFPLVALATSAPVTPHRTVLRYDRRLLEVSEALAQVHIPSGEVPLDDVDQPHPLARALVRSRNLWTDNQGTRAADLLPPVSDAADERQHILGLADAYREAIRSTHHHYIPAEMQA